MNFVETKFYYKNHILESNLRIEIMSKKWPQKPKNCRLNHKHKKISTLEKNLKLFLKN